MDAQRNECLQVISSLDDYMDGLLTKQQEAELFEHAKTCENCRKLWNAQKAMRENLSRVDDGIVPPLAAKAAWRNAVRKQKKSGFAQKTRVLGSIAAAILLMVMGTFALRGAGLVSNGKLVNAEDTETVETFAVNAFVRLGNVENEEKSSSMVGKKSAVLLESDGLEDAVLPLNVQQTAKMRITATLESESEQPRQDYETLKGLVSEYNGYFESDTYSKTEQGASYQSVIRVPVEWFEDFLASAQSIGETVYANTIRENTDSGVFDAESRIAAQEAAALRLTELIGDADGEQLYSLLSELSDIYAQIDSLRASAQSYEAETAYATVYYTLREKAAVATAVKTQSENAILKRTKNAFASSVKAVWGFMQDMVVTLAIAAPILLIAAACAAVFLAVYYALAKRNKNES